MNYTEFSKTDFFKHSTFLENFETKIQKLDDWEFIASNFRNWSQNLNKKTIEHPIPHKIHQIWMGSELPKQYINWCKSWQKLNPTWEYKLWNEKDIIDILPSQNRESFMKSKSFGPKGDIARYAILDKFGGVYADTDFECLKPLDDIVNTCSLFAGNTYTSIPELSGAIFGSCPNHPILKILLENLSNPILTNNSNNILQLSGPAYVTRIIFEHKEMLYNTDVFFPSNYFYPLPDNLRNKKQCNQLKKEFVKPESYGIHYWEVSWEKRDFIYYVKKLTKKIIFYKYWKK